MRWRKAFILTNRNAKFYFVAVDLEGEVNGFLREVMTNGQQQSPKRVGEPSSFKFQNFASLVILIIVAENKLIVVKEVGSVFADYGNVKH